MMFTKMEFLALLHACTDWQIKMEKGKVDVPPEHPLCVAKHKLHLASLQWGLWYPPSKALEQENDTQIAWLNKWGGSPDEHDPRQPSPGLKFETTVTLKKVNQRKARKK